MIQKKRIFVNGAANSITPVMPADPSKAKNLEDFRPIGDVLPIVPSQEMNGAQDYQNLFSST